MRLERLSDGEMDTELARLRIPVHDQARYGIELVADVHTDRPDRRQIAYAGTHVVTDIAECQRPRIEPDVAGISEDNARQVAPQRRAQLERALEFRQAADGEPGIERTDFEAAFFVKAAGTTEKVTLEERHV